ncbi:MAG: ribbon-helix-helix protein, CopG family [Planctomycetes bacterium]|nr:ribbon-helix-helix protein, CopG family [Planctomycetota bacterium]
MAALHRTQILLEPEQHQALAQMAQDAGRSVSDIVREILRERLARETKEAKHRELMETLARLKKFCDEVQAKHGVIDFDPVEEVREEADREMERVLRGEG